MSIEYFQRRQHILIDKLAKENLDGMIVTNLTHIGIYVVLLDQVQHY